MLRCYANSPALSVLIVVDRFSSADVIVGHRYDSQELQVALALNTPPGIPSELEGVCPPGRGEAS